MEKTKNEGEVLDGEKMKFLNYFAGVFDVSESNCLTGRCKAALTRAVGRV